MTKQNMTEIIKNYNTEMDAAQAAKQKYQQWCDGVVIPAFNKACLELRAAQNVAGGQDAEVMGTGVVLTLTAGKPPERPADKQLLATLTISMGNGCKPVAAVRLGYTVFVVPNTKSTRIGGDKVKPQQIELESAEEFEQRINDFAERALWYFVKGFENPSEVEQLYAK